MPYDLLSLLWAQRPAPYAPDVSSEFTTPEDLRRARISEALGWDVGRPGQEFLRRLFSDVLPMMPGRGAGTVRGARAPVAQPDPRATLVQDYVARFGYPPPSIMSNDAIRTWINGPFSRGPRGDYAPRTPVPPVAPAPLSQPPPAPPHSAPPQARRDLSALNHDGVDYGLRWGDPVRAQSYLSALEAFQQARPPMSRRLLHGAAPLGLLDIDRDSQP